MSDGFVAVHTGAGNSIDEKKYNRVIKESCIRATEILKRGGSALDACESAIMRLENCGNTNAGFGSNLCWDGTVECDASIMCGATLRFGGCTNIRKLKNPIQLARCICERQGKSLLMDRIPPMVMAATGAECYAQEMGCTMIAPSALISSKAQTQFDYYKAKCAAAINKSYSATEEPADPKIAPALDTVGAVCIDKYGNTAAGCSSGGILLKMPGRIGQAATYGAGCWATDTKDLAVATCTTGNGEYIMKTMLAKEICTDAFTNECAVTSLHKTFKTKFLESPFLNQRHELYAGALTLLYYPKDTRGELLWSHTTQAFCVGYMATTQKAPKFVFSALPTYSEPGRSCVVNGHNFHLRI